MQAPHVVGQAKHVELALVRVEVAADAREHPGAVVERVGQQPQLRIGVGQDAVVKKGHAGKSHRCLLVSNLEFRPSIALPTGFVCLLSPTPPP